MSNVYVKINYKGVQELLKSPAMREVVGEYAEKIKGRASGANYAVSVGETSQRARASVYTADPQAMAHELKTNTLLKALGGKG